MKQEEWLAEFERIHGRPASQEEYQQAWGLFRNPETSQGTVDGPKSTGSCTDGRFGLKNGASSATSCVSSHRRSK